MAVYSLADAVNVTFAFALRGAGDTRFVTLLTFALAWPIMVMPTYRAWCRAGGEHLLGVGVRDGVHLAMAVCFCCGSAAASGRAMRVIEAAPGPAELPSAAITSHW